MDIFVLLSEPPLLRKYGKIKKKIYAFLDEFGPEIKSISTLVFKSIIIPNFFHIETFPELKIL